MSDEIKTAVITGAAGTLGRALSVRLARDRWRLALADRDLDERTETLREVREVGGEGRVERLDVTKVQQWYTLRDRLQAIWPQIDLLANNAGVAGVDTFDNTPLSDWQWIMDTNLLGPVYGCHVMLPWLKQNPRGGHILNTASIAGLISPPSMGAYNVAKAGLVALSETLYAELAPHNVWVTVLCPGFFQSNLVDSGRFESTRCRDLAAKLMKRSRFTADDLAERAVRGMRRRKLFVVHDWKSRLLWRFKRLTPSGFHCFLRVALKRHIEKVEAERNVADFSSWDAQPLPETTEDAQPEIREPDAMAEPRRSPPGRVVS